MKRITAATFAVGLACAITVSAQQTQTVTETTQSSAGDVKTITYTGCVSNGTETKSYVLNKVVPMTRTTETVGTSGTMTKTETSYVLVPGETVQIEQHVGRKVEVTGVLIPGADTQKTTTTTMTRTPDGAVSNERTVTETAKASAPASQFRVTSIKDLAERCE